MFSAATYPVKTLPRPGNFTTSILLLLCILAFPLQAFSHSLSGTVYLGAQPLVDTSVTLMDRTTNTVIESVATDTTGVYQFTIDNGQYDLIVGPPVVLGLSQSLVEDVVIADADQTYHIVLIEPEVIVSGVVTGADGTPASGVQLAVYNKYNGMNAGIVTTGESGTYTLPLAKGVYTVNAQGSGAYSNIPLPETWRIAPISSALSLTADTTLNITLPNVALTGQIVDVRGNPVVGATLRTTLGWNRDGTYFLVNNSSGTLKSNNEGRFLIPLFANASYDVAIMPVITSGLAAAAIKLEFLDANRVQNLVLNDASILSGKVSASDGTALKGVDLYLFDSVTNVSIGSTTTDESGQYSFPVSTGSYTIHAGGYGKNQNIPMPERWYINPIAKQVLVTGNRNLDLVLPTVKMNARLIDGIGRSVSGTRLRFNESWLRDGVSYSVSSVSDSIVSDSAGNIVTHLFRHSDYDFDFVVATPGIYANTDYRNLAIDGDLSQTFVIHDSYSVTGTVRLPDSTTLNNVQVSFFEQSSGQWVADTYTDTSGRYSTSLSSGHYRIDVRGRGTIAGDGMPQNWFVGSIVSHLNLGTDTVQDIVLPVTRVSGSVYDSNGNPVSGVNLLVSNSWTAGGSQYVVNNGTGYLRTDESGGYSFYAFSYRDYNITIVPPAGADLVKEVIRGIDVASTPHQDFTFSPTLILQGNVRTPTGQPVSGVVLSLIDNNTLLNSASYTTATDGYYRFPVIAGDYSIDASGNGAVSNIPLPSYWHVKPIIASVAMSEDRMQDIILPVATITGKTTDSNGVPVGGVEFLFNQTWRNVDVDYRVQSYAGRYRSATDGSYTMSLLLADAYSETVVPPVGSGFSRITIDNLKLDKSIKQNVILVYADTQAPKIIAGPYVRNITDTEAVVVWQTDEPASSSIDYGATALTMHAADPGNYVKDHAIRLSSLTPDTTYQVKVSSTDQHGNGATESSIVSFTTLSTPDTQAPLIINGPIISAISDDSAVVEWQTNEVTRGTVQYGLSLANEPLTTDLVLSTLDNQILLQHSVLLTGLSASSVYSLRIAATDSAGNGPVNSHLLQFMTQAKPDAMAPIIVAGPLVTDITSTSATIVWTTDEPSISGVSYNDGSNYGVVSDTQYSVDHVVHLTNLTPNQEYQFTVSSTDRVDNGPTLSTESQFVTAANTDSDPPVFTLDPEVVVTTHQSAVIRWGTDEPADSIVEYGLAADNLDQAEIRAALVTHHNLAITGLLPQQEYFFRVISVDAAGNRLQSTASYSFYTVNGPDTTAPGFTQLPIVTGKTDSTVTLEWITDEYTDSVIEYSQESASANHEVKRQTGHELDDGHRDADRAHGNKQQVTLSGLDADKLCDLKLHVTDVSGNTTSILGKDISLQVRTQALPDDTAPSLIGDVAITHINDDTALVEWTSDELANAIVTFNEKGKPLTRQVGDIEFSTVHRVMLTKLRPGTPYQLRVVSSDVAGNQFISDSVYEFITTYKTDITAPVISAIKAQNVTYSSANIEWMTDDYSQSDLRFGVFADQLDSVVNQIDFRQDHLVSLQSLAQGITYYYQISTLDMAGNKTLSEIYSFTTLGVAVDTDHDGEADALDADDDNDGIPDTVELRYGLNHLNASDATQDNDRDGMNNLEEYLLGTDLLRDTVAPVISIPADVTIASTGTVTKYALGSVTAIDAVDGKISASQNHSGFFKPGINEVVWTATDSKDNTAQYIQHINVIPQVNLAVDQMVGEGGQVNVKAQLNGNAVTYPVTVKYTAGGTATVGSDFSTLTGELVISEGTEAEFSIDILQDFISDPDETIVIQLTSALNAVLGPMDTQIITVVERNLAPRVNLLVEQGGQSTRVIAKDAGLFAVTATINDGNSADTHTLDWSGSDNNLLSYATVMENALRIDPTNLPEGLYSVRVSVTDNGVPAKTTTVDVLLRVIANSVYLSDVSDSDADGISDALEAYTDHDADGVYDYLDNIAATNVLQTLTNDGESGLMNTVPGLNLSLGELAFRLQLNAATISLNDLAGSELQESSDKDYRRSVGGIFDFTVSGLQYTGQSVPVVIPLSQTIPLDPVYRKYQTGTGWVDFLIDSHNQIASAPGDAGVCPNAGDESFTAGLHPGDYCIQLTIEDGGPNDQDGMANGVIKDPGGIFGATEASAGSTVSSQSQGETNKSDTGGGGATSYIWLWTIMLFLLSRQFRMHRISITIASRPR